MSIPKKNHEPIRQNSEIVKKPQKHDVNLRKNSNLYFQIGLIICLIASYGFLEMEFQKGIPHDYGDTIMPDASTEILIENFKIYEEPKADIQPLELQKKVVLTKEPIIVPDGFNIKNPISVVTGDQNTANNKSVDPGAIKVVLPPDEEDVIFINVEQVPIFPGCENKKSNDEKRKCMSDKINQLVQKKFNTNLGSELGLHGKQVITTQFKIDKMGQVTHIKVRGTHPDLEAEAQRVIKTIPEMTPGKQRDKNVGVIYTLPIIFEVQD